jgi:hypothetical protein
MTNPIDRRLDRLETEVQKRTGRGPIFALMDDSRDPENGKRLQEAAPFKRDNPNGQIIHQIIVHPPNGEPNWDRFIRSGTNVNPRGSAQRGNKGGVNATATTASKAIGR